MWDEDFVDQRDGSYPVETDGLDVDAQGCIVVTDEDLAAIDQMWQEVDEDDDEEWQAYVLALHEDDEEVDEAQSGQCDWMWA